MAKIFLDSGDTNFVITNNNTQVFGSSGIESIKINNNVTGVILDSLIETTELGSNVADYTYQAAGAGIKVIDAAGNQVALLAANAGSKAVFKDGAVDLTMSTTTGAVSLGDTVVPTAAPGVLAPTLDTTTKSTVGGSSTDVTAPVLTSAAVNGSSLVLTYDEALAASTPVAADFTVSVGGVAQAAATDVDVTGTTVTLTLAAAVVNGDVVTVSYTPGTNKVQDAADNASVALTASAVTNTTADITAPVLTSATVDGTSLVLTYGEALAASTPAVGDFSVTVGAAAAVAPTVVAVTGTTVTLTLAAAAVNGDVVTVSYTPGTNKVKDAADNASVALTASAVTNNTIIPSQTFTLTTGTDAIADFTGGAGNDVFTASVLTANDNDSLDGGGGTGDILNLETAANITSLFVTTGIETINLSALGAVQVDTTNLTGITTFNSNDANGAVTVNAIANTSATYGVSGAATNNVTLNYGTGVLNGSADKLMVNLNGSSATTINADSGFESAEVSTTAASSLTSLVAPNATALTLSGAGTLTLAAGAVNTFTDYTITNTGKLTYNDITSVKTFSASTNTDGVVGADLVGGLGLDATTTADVLTLSNTGTLVQTGSGADNINVNTSALFTSGSAIVKLGAGNDILNISGVSSSGEYYFGEDGNDLIFVGGALTSADLIDGGIGTDTVSFGAGTHALIAKGIEAVNVASATTVTDSVTFTAVDSAVAITDSGAGVTTFSNLKTGSTYSSTVKKAGVTDDITLGFATSSAATLDVQLTKGTSGDLTLTNVADVTVTLGAASTMATGITLDSAATKLTVNATGATDLSDIIAGTAGDTTTVEKLASITVNGNLGVTITDITNDKSIASLAVTSSATTTNTGDVTVGAVNSDVAVTSINVSSAGGSAAIGAIDAANAAFTGGLTTLTVSGVDTATASSVTSITADDLGTASVTNTGANSTIGAMTITGSTADLTDGIVGTITVSGGTGASSTGTLAADSIGTVTVTGTGLASTATIGAITVLGTAATTDGTVTALKASAVGAATIATLKADSVGSIIVESTSTTSGATATLNAITDGATGAFATLGTIDVTSAAGAATIAAAITADALGNTTVTGATTADLTGITVDNASDASVAGNITVTAGTLAATLTNALLFDTVGTITVKSTSGAVVIDDITALNTAGLTVGLDAGTTITGTGAAIISNVKGDLNITLKGTTSSGVNAIAGEVATTDADIIYTASSMSGVISSTTVTNNSTDANSSIGVTGGASTNTFILTGATTGTVSYQGQGGADNVTISQAVGSAIINGEGGIDTIVLTTTDTMANTITFNGGALTDVLTLVDTGLVDADLANVSLVETLTLSGASTVTLGTNAIAAGIVTINGSGGTDVINASAMTPALTITGGNGTNTITGGTSTDTITGGSGVDTIVVGSTTASADAINTFTSGTDKLKLSTTVLNGAVATIVDGGDLSGSTTFAAALGTGTGDTRLVLDNAAFDIDTSLTAFLAAPSSTTATAVVNAAVTAITATSMAGLDAEFLAAETVLLVLDGGTGTSGALFEFKNTTATGNTIDAGELVLLGVTDVVMTQANTDIIL